MRLDEIDDPEVWSAVGMLMGGYNLGLDAAWTSLYEAATDLDVPPADVAAYVSWTGRLPA